MVFTVPVADPPLGTSSPQKGYLSCLVDGLAQRVEARPGSAGFTLERNLHDTLMVVCPLPPAAEWDDGFHAKMKLLLAKGLSPQLFLTAAELRTAPQG